MENHDCLYVRVEVGGGLPRRANPPTQPAFEQPLRAECAQGGKPPEQP